VSSPLEKYITNIPNDPNELQSLLDEVKDLFIQEPNIIKIKKSSCFFIGDTHGDFNSSKAAARKFLKEKDAILIFLGDYVDRGAQQLENILFLFLLKKDNPENVILLRGNHEEKLMNQDYGFQSVLSKAFGTNFKQVFIHFQETFSQLPLCVLTWNRIFGVHGGIPISLTNSVISLKEIEQCERGTIYIEDFDFITAQLLWNDPKEYLNGAVPSTRGIGFYFGKDKFEQFIDTNNIQAVIRSHEVFQSGYKYFFDKQLISIFSAANYASIRGIQAKMVHLASNGTFTLENIVD